MDALAVGIIANPSSGKDIRRLVARGSVFDNNEKINIVRRVLVGLAAVGVTNIYYMPDYFGIVPRALDGVHLELKAECLSMRENGDQRDSTEAARLLEELGVGCLVTLGGDGTNRAVARGSCSLPIVAISTGTNNVFPELVEGTLAGLAAGLVATGAIERSEACRPTKLIEVLVDGVAVDIALVDVAFSRDRFVGARAVWDPAAIRELVLATAAPGTIGLSSIGAHLSPVERDEPAGLHLRLGANVPTNSVLLGLRVLAPIAPGLIAEVAVASHRRLVIGETVELALATGSLALDGEREIIVSARQQVAVRLTFDGPPVIDVSRALAAGARAGRFIVG